MSFYPPLEPVEITANGVERMYYRRDGRLVHLWPSNFFVRPLYIMGYTVSSNEHWYQAMKSLIRDEREAVLAAVTPGDAKRMGRKDITLRPDWESVKNSVMWTGLHEKFAPGTDFAEALTATGEVSSWRATPTTTTCGATARAGARPVMSTARTASAGCSCVVVRSCSKPERLVSVVQ